MVGTPDGEESPAMHPLDDQSQPLDEHHVLEPVDAVSSGRGQRLVRDIDGHLWRVRWRPDPADMLAGGAVLVIVALVLALALLWR